MQTDPIARSPTVLVVEDELLIRLAVADHLRECGFEVLECGSAEEARTVFLSGVRIDVVFSDVNMPGPRDGIELAMWVEANYPHAVMILTSGVQDALKSAGEACKNVRHFVEKPYQHSAVEKLLRTYSS